MEPSSENDLPPAETPPAKLGMVWAAVFASLIAFSAIRSPAPGVNEPHYLCKAKHYWNPEWCAGDFFLESAHTHLVFYQTVGIFTQVVSLAVTAWIGRALALAILAWGWVRLVGQVVPGRWASLWAVWIYLAIAAVGNWSGEWMVGGIEGKVFAYGFGFWAVAAWWDRHIKRSALFAGLAVSFHPVVGGWIVISAAAAIVATSFLRTRRDSEQEAERHRPLSLPEWGVAAVIFVLACLWGIVPALSVLENGDVRQANIITRIQVFYRIQHHLDPMTFSHMRYAAYGLMAVLWLIARFRLGWGRRERWFAWFVGASIVIALVGIGLGYGERPIASNSDVTWRYRLLKFYPFRLADILVPVAVAVTIAGIAAQTARSEAFTHWLGTFRQARVRCWLLFASLFAFSLATPAVDHNPSRMSDEQLRDWLAVCQWIREETPLGTVVWTPKNSWAFKWYAQRAEYVSHKDCPQNPAGILEWNERLRTPLHDAFREEPRMNFAIFRKGKGKLPITPIYENATYRIYDLSAFSRE